jgi:hypothetical protein
MLAVLTGASLPYKPAQQQEINKCVHQLKDT